MGPHIFKGRLPPFIIYNSPFTIFIGPLPPLSWSPSPRQAVGGKILRKRPLRHYAYLSTPVWGWVASGARRKGVASAGSYKNGAPYFQRAPSSIYHLPFTIYHFQRPPSTTIVVPLPRQVEVHSTSSHTSSYSNSDTLRSRSPATRACYPGTSG